MIKRLKIFTMAALVVLAACDEGEDGIGPAVTVTPTADNIEPGITSLVDTTDAGGLFDFASLREGPYTVSVTGTAEWQPRDPESGTITVDMENQGDNDILNFIVRRMDTEIHGVVVNDRDVDLNTIDIGEALPGVMVELYHDNDTLDVTLDADSLDLTAITDANGAYSFTGLPEGRYAVSVMQPGNAVVLRAYEASGAVRDTAIAHTVATTVGSGADFTRVVGTTTPATLPRWNYDNSSVMFNDRTHFTFLVDGNITRGEIEPFGGGAPLVGKLVDLRRCVVSTTTPSTSPPTGPSMCDTYFAGDPLAAATDATGFFTYSNLTEGVYEVTPRDASTPAVQLFRLVRAGEAPDNERGDFTQP